ADREQAGLVEPLSHRASVGDAARQLPRSLYIHIPFCVSKCPYCDFNSHVGLQHLYGAYAAALVTEIRSWGREFGGGPLDTVFIGGGTPSLVPAAAIRQVMDAVRDSFQLAPDAEVTIEANPHSAEAARIDEWLEAGVTRLSLGVQSLDDPSLRFLERAHDAAEALRVMRRARAAGLASLSFDLIYGIPGLSTARWGEVVDEALAFGPDHVSAYELTPEDGTRLGADVRAGHTILPDADTQLQQQAIAREKLMAAGFDHYEVSNWARPGHYSRHNLAYWSGVPYMAAGAGAHAFLHTPRVPGWAGPIPAGARTLREWNVAAPAAYIAAVKATGTAVSGSEWLDLATTASDLVMMGLRLRQGLDLAQLEGMLPGLQAEVEVTADRLVAQGLLARAGSRLRTTTRGAEVLNRVAAEFLP
ncbi:MAG: radical SAM family heme chaperone HemW, partial [Candidatus Dormibacteria bacterium]